MTHPKAVIFDIGNVLLRWDPDRLYGQLIPDQAERDAFFAETGMAQVNLDIDGGAPFKKTIYDHAEAHPKYADLIRAWHDRWDDMAYALIDDSCAILQQLRDRNVPVFALSNFGVDSFAHAEGRFPILKEFDRRYISGHMRLTKPDPAIYRAVEADCGLSGDQLFFIDDSGDNIAAAARLEWHTYQFKSADILLNRLRSFELLP